jgi:D-amino peptidase
MANPAKRLLAAAAALFLSAPALAEPARLKVYISADMEGIGGVSTWDKQSSPKGADYAQFRKLMTHEVNAAIAGAFDAGATEVLVSDSHWDGMNLDLELLDRRARVIQSWPRPLSMMGGIDSSFDAALLVGYHAAEGTGGAILAHSVSGGRIFEIKLNGVPVPEAGFCAAIAGELGVPVVFLSGDQIATEQAQKLLGPIETATVKTSNGFLSGILMHPEESRRLVREGARRGVERRRELKPYRLARPVKLEVTFKRVVLAEVASYLPGVERPRGNAIVYTGRDMLEAARFFSAIMFLDVN